MNPRRSVQYLVIVLLLAALGFTSSAAVAYWNDVRNVSNVVVNFSDEEAELLIEQTSEDFSGTLVPQFYDIFEGQTDEAEFTYTVSVDKTLVKEVNLIVEAINVQIGGSDQYADLVNVIINANDGYHVNNLFNSEVTITVVVSIDEPIDLAEAISKGLDQSMVNVEDSVAAYEAIKGETISFTLSFTVEPKETTNVE
eukprot:Anaeramoba_flamelloidesa327141_154.p2 GENE.a327141_154~~a327141_154.p2  ORF type:complete len:197 (+),score=12.46 a327141_154:124-714(+)